MLKAMESADSNKDLEIDAQELADALKILKPGELQRWLKNKSEKISKLGGISDAVTDLIAKHTDGSIDLDSKQETSLYALHESISNGWAKVNLKKESATINTNKEFVQDQVWKNNIDKVLEGSGYTFVNWLYDEWKDNQWIAVITNSKNDERYHIAFEPDGSLKTTTIKETYTIDGVLKEANPKMAYLNSDKSLVVEDKELFDKKAKTKEFANTLDALSVDGIFLKKQKDDGSMDVAYYSDAALSSAVKPLFEKGDGIDPAAKKLFDTYNSQITLATSAMDVAKKTFDSEKVRIDATSSRTMEASRKQEIVKLQTTLDWELKKQQTAIDTNNKNLTDLYKTYASANAESLIDKTTDKFTINTALDLVNASWEVVPLTIDGKNTTENVSGHVALDNNNLLLRIDKTSTQTGWTAYKKKGTDGVVYTQDSKGIDVANPTIKTKETVSDGLKWTDKIDALKSGFMFDGTRSIKDKEWALASWKEALKKLAIDPSKEESFSNIYDGLAAAEIAWNKSSVQIESIKSVQKILGVTQDGFRWPFSHAKLLEFAWVTPKATPVPVVSKEENPIAGANVVPVAKKPDVAAPKTEVKKQPIDVLATEKQKLLTLQENAKKTINPLLQKLVPKGISMEDYKTHLPKNYNQKLQLLDTTFKKDPKSIVDKTLFNKEYIDMENNVTNLKASLTLLSKRKILDFDLLDSKSNQDMVNKKLVSVTGFPKATLDNSRNNDLENGYIKFLDPSNNPFSSWIPANFLTSPVYKNGERSLRIDQGILETSIKERVKQTRDLTSPENKSKEFFV